MLYDGLHSSIVLVCLVLYVCPCVSVLVLSVWACTCVSCTVARMCCVYLVLCVLVGLSLCCALCGFPCGSLVCLSLCCMYLACCTTSLVMWCCWIAYLGSATALQMNGDSVSVCHYINHLPSVGLSLALALACWELCSCGRIVASTKQHAKDEKN